MTERQIDIYCCRKAVPRDCKEIMEMIMELAEYEKMTDQVKMTADVLERDGFSERPLFSCFVAEEISTKRLVAYELYYFIYPTWAGKCIYLEDLYVRPSNRGQGIGMKLLSLIAKEAVAENCLRMQWTVLNWNEASIEFYKKKLGAIDLTVDEKWHLFRVYRNEIVKMAQESS